MGVSRPGDMGFDVVHFNLHKTFSTPHGGGGPGAGPVAVTDALEPYLPAPRGRAARRRHVRARPRPAALDRPAEGVPSATSACWCAPTPTSARWAPTGMRDVAETAVLNANYLLARPARRLRPAVRPHLHARVRALGPHAQARARRARARRREAAHGLRLPPADDLLPAARRRGADDRADRDRDEGDARSLRRRDAAIAEEAATTPELVHEAPHVTPVRRLDEVKAAKEPVLRAR